MVGELSIAIVAGDTGTDMCCVCAKPNLLAPAAAFPSSPAFRRLPGPQYKVGDGPARIVFLHFFLEISNYALVRFVLRFSWTRHQYKLVKLARITTSPSHPGIIAKEILDPRSPLLLNPLTNKLTPLPANLG